MGILHDRRHQWAWLCSWCVWCRSELWAVNWKVQVLLTIGNISCDQLSQHLKMTTTRPSTARALAYLHCQPFLCTWNFDTPKHFGQFWFRLLFIVIRNPLASGIVDPIGSLIGIWFDILRYVLPSNACLLEFVIAIGFEMLACKVYKRGKNIICIYLNVCSLILHLYAHTWAHIHTWVRTCKNTFTMPKPCDCVGESVPAALIAATYFVVWW